MNPGRRDREWTDAEIGRAVGRLEQSVGRVSDQLQRMADGYVTRNEWNQRLMHTDQRMDRIDQEVRSIETRLLGTSGRVVQILTPIIDTRVRNSSDPSIPAARRP